ncbi:opioid-binding protein/cell adhesion molecule homolog isoform X2 [Patella vulgata]|uniref:opioid-binding protein/cell adhesion molecule homolog isoform X2 n=1 Tax=Patella vulgata TaxID=6465 RepID=UPI00218047DE|nr:opioid-binding protein/cell adhesion molecule homolog isoform X2 [Patella vulgata]
METLALFLDFLLSMSFVKIVEAITLEPSFDVPMVNVTVKEGTTAILPCSVKFLGQHQVIWTDQWSTLLTFEDRRIIDDERISVERPFTKDWNLHIRHVKYSDQGIYNCQINTSPVKIKTVNLKVQVPAVIIHHLSSEDQTAKEGETVTLVCNVTGIPMPTVTWYRHRSSEKGFEKERIGVSGEVLIIHNVSRYCGDTYECVAFNGVPPAVNKQIKVGVEFQPEVRLPNRRIGQIVGKETILECVITAFPQAVSVWLWEGTELSNSRKYRIEIYDEGEHTITLSLRIRALEYSDFGRYSCMASNPLGTDKEEMVLYDYTAHRSTTTTTTPAPVTTVNTRIVTLHPHATQGPLNPPIIPYNYDKYENTDFVTQRPRITPFPSRPVHAGKGFSASTKTSNHKLCLGNLMPVCSAAKTLESSMIDNCSLTAPSTYVIAITFIFFHKVLRDMFQ